MLTDSQATVRAPVQVLVSGLIEKLMSRSTIFEQGTRLQSRIVLDLPFYTPKGRVLKMHRMVYRKQCVLENVNSVPESAYQSLGFSITSIS